MIKTFCCLLLLCVCLCGLSQQYPPGKVYRITSSHSMFPDSLRNAQPRVYDGKTYAAAEHYSDSSVFIFVPDYFDKKKPASFLFWFHGWTNNIDSALARFQVLDQFYTAHQNAIFIFPEGPKNAPDSYGGKLEKPGVFTLLLQDVLDFLSSKKQVAKKYQPAAIMLAGHSGAYRVMGKITGANPSLNIAEIYLFDALYGEIENYLAFAKRPVRFINIYTDNGGTKQNSIDFSRTMDSLHIPYLHKEEDDLTKEDLKNNPIIFLHSKKGHSDVIDNNRNFERFLRKE